MGSVPNDTTTSSTKETLFNVAVIGGGIGGLSLAIGLLKHPHINVQVYESAPAFGEIGAGVSIAPNAQRALELISPDARAAFDKHSTENMWTSHKHIFVRNVVGKGDREGELIASETNSSGMTSVHRAKFLEELVKCVPAYRAHFSKRLSTIEDKGNAEPLVLHFKDGTTATADAVIGADGIHSAVRQHILGHDNPLTQPVFSGAVGYRGLVPMDAAVEKLGAETAQNATILCGPRKAVMSYPIDHGATLNLVAMDFEQDTWEHEKWIVPVAYSDLAKKYEGWGNSAQAMIELLSTPNLAAWALFQSAPAPYFNKGRVAMMGDAAHSTTPFQGQGAAQAIEDALVLETLLGKVRTMGHLSNAFAAYDQARRPRSQRVVTTSTESGQLVGMRLPGVGGDVDKMAAEMRTRMHWIWNRDLIAQNATALKLYEESL